MEVAATKAKKKRGLSTVCKARNRRREHWENPRRRTADALNYPSNIREPQ